MNRCVKVTNLKTHKYVDCDVPVMDELDFVNKIAKHLEPDVCFSMSLTNSTYLVCNTDPMFVEKVDDDVLQIFEHIYSNDIDLKFNKICHLLKDRGYSVNEQELRSFTHELAKQDGGGLWGKYKNTKALNVLDWVLIFLGLIPVLGEVFDVTAIAVAYARGNKVDLITAIVAAVLGIVPIAGDVLGGMIRVAGKFFGKGMAKTIIKSQLKR